MTIAVDLGRKATEQTINDLPKRSRITFATGKSKRLYHELSINDTNIHISGSIYDYPHLELSEKSCFLIEIFVPSLWTKYNATCLRR